MGSLGSHYTKNSTHSNRESSAWYPRHLTHLWHTDRSKDACNGTDWRIIRRNLDTAPIRRGHRFIALRCEFDEDTVPLHLVSLTFPNLQRHDVGDADRLAWAHTSRDATERLRGDAETGRAATDSRRCPLPALVQCCLPAAQHRGVGSPKVLGQQAVPTLFVLTCV